MLCCVNVKAVIEDLGFKSKNSGFDIIAFKVFDCMIKSEEKEFLKCFLIFLFS